MAVIGVDEAGKGPVLGSMFAAAVRWSAGQETPPELADSKQLTAEQHRTIASRLRSADGITVGIAEVAVSRIDAAGTDMNTLTLEAQAEALATVGRFGDMARCDAADVDADRFGGRLADALEPIGRDGIDIRAEHRADERYAIVSAASVLAKVARDAHVDELAAEYGEIGSGYPGDPATQAFLEDHISDHGDLPDCARASWATSQDALAAADQVALNEF